MRVEILEALQEMFSKWVGGDRVTLYVAVKGHDGCQMQLDGAGR